MVKCIDTQTLEHPFLQKVGEFCHCLLFAQTTKRINLFYNRHAPSGWQPAVANSLLWANAELFLCLL